MDDQSDPDAVYREAFTKAKAQEALEADKFWRSVQHYATPTHSSNTKSSSEPNAKSRGLNDRIITPAPTQPNSLASSELVVPASDAIRMLPSFKIPKRNIANQTETVAPFSGRTYIQESARSQNDTQQNLPGFRSNSSRLSAEVATMVSSTPDTKGVSLDSDVLMDFEVAPLPDWYRQIDTRHTRQNLSEDAQFLMRLRYAVTAYLHATAQQRTEKLQTIRQILHVMEHLHFEDWMIKRSKILDPSNDVNGLPCLFRTHHDGFVFPIDIRLDSRALYLKIYRCDLDPDILRGVMNVSSKSRRSWKLDPSYPNRISAKFYGSGDLVSGQWWPLRIAALRDGAHGSLEAGIFGNKDLGGAMAIVVAGAYPEDQDYGNEIQYCGTKANQYAPEPTKDTQLLLKNITSRKPVRVLRTSKLPTSNMYRPAQGIRYDGTYTVESCEVLEGTTHFYRFKLLREQSQPPIRYKGSMIKPTAQDVEAFEQHKWLTSGQVE